MNNKIKIHTFPIDHWFESRQDTDIYRRIYFYSKGNNQFINTRLTPSFGPDPYSDLMTEQELITFLRIPEVSKANDYHNVVKNLIRMHDLPRIQICKRLLFPRKAILAWIDKQTIPRMSLTDCTD